MCAAWVRARALAAAGLRVVGAKRAEELARGGERQPGGPNRAHVDDDSDSLRPAHAPHREAVLVEDVEELIGEDLGALARVAIGSDEHRRRATAVEAAQHHAPRRRAQLLSQRLRRPPPLSPSHVGCDRLEGSERAERRLHGLQEAKQLVVVVPAGKDELGVEEQHALNRALPSARGHTSKLNETRYPNGKIWWQYQRSTKADAYVVHCNWVKFNKKTRLRRGPTIRVDPAECAPLAARDEAGVPARAWPMRSRAVTFVAQAR